MEGNILGIVSIKEMFRIQKMILWSEIPKQLTGTAASRRVA
jgi:hypothetical protein